MQHKTIRKSLAGLALGVSLSIAWVLGSGFVKDVQFAQAQERVDATRAQIANVQDLAAVYKAVGKAVEPSVVSIDVRKTVRTNQMLRDFFPDRNGDGEPDVPRNFNFNVPEQFQQQGTGSGVIMEVDGKTAYVVTNNHVAGNASEMVVTLSDGREIKDAKLVGADPKTDIAVVKFEDEHLIPAKWGDSDTLEKGDMIMAFGSPFGYVGSMTHGIVSSLHRQAGIIRGQFAYENFIQVDAPINPGNSGGPLVNLKGEVVGINTAIASESGGSEGVGFAIPANQVKQVYESIKTKGKVVRGWLGVEINDVTKERELASSLGYTERQGVIVRGIMRRTPAIGKLKLDDIIVSIDGKPTRNVQDLRHQIAALAPETDIKLGVIREGKQQEVTVTLGEQPEDMRSIASARPEDSRPGDANRLTPESLGLTLAAVSSDLIQRFGLDDGAQGVVVESMRPGSLGQTAGLKAGDLITKIDATSIHSPEDANKALAGKDLAKGIRFYVTNREGTRTLFLKSE